VAEDVDEQAPHGRDENGTPKAPFGYKANGDPRLSNRGRPPANAGPKVAAPQKKSTGAKTSGTKKPARTAKETKDQLLGLADMVLMPLAAAGLAPAVRARIGERQGDALAGDAVILQAVAPDIVDGVMAYAERKPGLLAWMDRAEDAAPAFMLAKAIGQAAVAIGRNHMQPSRELAAGARSMVNAKALEYARAMADMELQMAQETEAAENELAAYRERQAATIPDQRAA
jgi:hypothetical protein